MFELSALLAAPVRALQPPSGVDASLLTELRGREFRFPVAGVRPARLPRDAQSLANLWKSISSPSPDHDPQWASAVWTALTAPVSRVPLVPQAEGGQEFAVSTVVETGASQVMALVRIGLAAPASRYSQPDIGCASAFVETDPQRMAEPLENLFLKALPQARAAAARGARRAVWLGGDAAVRSENPAWRDRVEAACAVVGLRVEVIEEPDRRVRNIQASLGAGPRPEVLLVWQPKCLAGESLTCAFRKLNPGGVAFSLTGDAFPDALARARIALAQSAATSLKATGRASRLRPVPGEERFYVKVGGSKADDILVDVADCGHGRWGSDTRRKAPRAAMGVEMLEGYRPQALFLCSRCTKHRWRARF